MRRWNGWGDDSITFALNADALEFLRERIGVGVAPADAELSQICQQLPASRLTAHALIDTSPETRLRHSSGQSVPDWLKMRYGKIQTFPDGVAYPESIEELRTLLDYAGQRNIALIPYGGGTSVVGHLQVIASDQPVLSVDMSRLCGLLDLDKEAQLARFGAGTFGPDIEAQLRAQGYTLGHFPQSFEYSTLGGWVVTRSSGQQSLGYGRIENLFAGGRVETPQGRLDIRPFPASAAGPDLREILLGSEGRMGILTEATVRIRPLPACEEFHAVFFHDWDAAQAAIRAIVQAEPGLSMLRLSNATETLTSLTLAGHKKMIGVLESYLRLRGCGSEKCLLLLGASGDGRHVRHAIRSSLKIARGWQGIHVGRYMGEKWKQGRFKNVYLRNSLWEQGYVVDTVETACDWSKVKGMMLGMEQTGKDIMSSEDEKLHVYTHLSHLYAQGASVYTTFVYRLSGDFDRDMARWYKLKSAISRFIVSHGGTISHQHGVGYDHAPYLAVEKGELGMSSLHHLYRHFDPKGIMNPGKLLPAEGSLR
ncbi:FAD-binding oxidoreductase [Undibacterium sp. CY18W]|uniref:FAD-binding oxidoreductase n=1 Tax=Undibacterium hunanense TaxID=2762292 RepID=A0ABR6ZP40_9BURK|nr:FAD-binding oxidoreductase [Undibacterium hunanense]MBC3917250.1 FAD-binding oxidoreductase [Undibacterium hunanense]